MDAAVKRLTRTSRANTSTMHLRPNTPTQRKAQPLFTSYLPDIPTDSNSPERKIQKQSGLKFNLTPTGEQKTHHQK